MCRQIMLCLLEGENKMHNILLCRSMSSAQRAARALRAEGIFASVTKAPQRANPRGCTYAVKIGERHLARAMQILALANIEIGKIFYDMPDGELREVQV